MKAKTIRSQEKSVVQSGQPTHFHMENRGPEIQVTADSDGVKINAKPAGLNVVAKPGIVPSTLPHAAVVSEMEHFPWSHAHHHHDFYHDGPIISPQLVHYNIEPMAYQSPINGLASIGDEFHYPNYGGSYLRSHIYDHPAHDMLHMPGYNYVNIGYDGLSGPLITSPESHNYMRWIDHIQHGYLPYHGDLPYGSYLPYYHHRHHHHRHFYPDYLHHYSADYHGFDD